MAKPTRRAQPTRNGRLEEALTQLLQAQAALEQTQATVIQNQAALLADHRAVERQLSERMNRIEAILLEHSRTLAEHTRLLEALPEVIRQQIRFRSPAQPA